MKISDMDGTAPLEALENGVDHGLDRNILILYASETGTAQDVAERIGRECIELRLHCRVLSMDIYPLDLLIDEPLVLFVCSTTGNGAEPKSMSRLWQTLLRSDLPEDLLDEMQFAVFGLGDSGYERFNWAAKKLQRRLLVLGGRELVKRGDGDEQDFYGIDSALDPWLSGLLGVLKTILPGWSETVPPTTDTNLPPSRVQVVAQNDIDALAEKVQSVDLDISSTREPSGRIPVTLTQNDRITRKDWFQDVRHVELESDQELRYEPGDVAVLYPSNDPADVDWLISRMGWASVADQSFTFPLNNPDWPLSIPLPVRCTLRSLLENYLHVTAVPRRSFFTWIQHFASDEREKEKLVDFCSKEGQEDLFAYTTRPRRTILEVLSDFKSVVIPLDYIVDVFPPIRPRSFSIASSAKAHPRQIHLCIAIVRYRSLLLKAPRKGLCTSWLANLTPGTRLRIGLEKGMMRLPEDRSKPVIMIGPGTGVAPLRAMAEERARDGAKENTLYFGCRSISADCHYHQDWKALEEKGTLRCRIAASRDQERKIYVQNLLDEDSHIIANLLALNGGYVYICGSSNQMPKAVRKAIVGALATQDGWDEDRCVKYVQSMEDEGRWSEECWS
ncbi:NAPDH-dependent diflavin reductase [Tulasnella sp. JGI-2019a]|nr:NAPDH-dependent diflavin reductase [Tulasnella sp. JGI-2019a]KAG9025077.1 NAPDH-dependent diflavin reductase [Tulasnella sp. JGI-2019a]